MDSLGEIGREYLPGLLGIEFDSVEDGVVRSHLELRQALFAPNGYVHAGAIVTLADTACGYGCLLKGSAKSLQAAGTNCGTVAMRRRYGDRAQRRSTASC